MSDHGWEPRLVALDIDGTLLKWVEGEGATYEQIPPATYDAVHRAMDAGCHVVLASGCRLAAQPTPDPFERIEVVLHPLRDVPRMIRDGELCHAQVIAAFALAQLHGRLQWEG